MRLSHLSIIFLIALTSCVSVDKFSQLSKSESIIQSEDPSKPPAWYRNKLEELVNINSGTMNVDGNERVRKYLIPLFEALGFSSHIVDSGMGPGYDGKQVMHKLLVFDFPNAKPDLIFIGHTDTVFEKSHKFQNFLDQGDIWRGPGITDMKAGILLAYHILSQIKNRDLLKRVRIALNDDEETGSKLSGPILKAYADQAKYGLIFESGSFADVSTSHSGIIWKEMTVFGVESHAGVAPLEGVNACLENSYKMIELYKYNNYPRGLNLNAGVISTYPAAKPNTICGEIKTTWDIRYIYQEDRKMINEKFEEITAKSFAPNPSKKLVRPAILAEVHSAPGMSPERSKFLLDIFKASAKKLNIDVNAQHKGGVDAYGIMDSSLHLITGIGVYGNGMHSDAEFMRADLYMKKFVLVHAFVVSLLNEY